MSVVWACPIPIEQLVRAGRTARPNGLRCPTCRGPLPFQGGYHRQLRHRGVIHRLWIWRGYCRACDTSHGLFPDFVVANHLDTVDTIHNAVIGNPDPHVPLSTRLGWRRRFVRNHRVLISACAATAVALGGDVQHFTYPAVLAALWAAATRRGDPVPAVWRIVNIISGMSWIRERVNSTWLIVGPYPRPP